MSSVEGFREFVNERLSAAAEEIFGVFKRTIVEYQEEIDRQRGLLDVFWKPEVRLHRIELPPSRVCKQEEVLSDQRLCLQEMNPSLDQEDPGPPQIKEEQEELCSGQEGEQHQKAVKHRSTSTREPQQQFLAPPEFPPSRVCKQEEVLSDQQLCLQEIKEEQEELCSGQEGEQLEPKQEADTFTLTPTGEEADHSEDQLLDWSTDETPSVVQKTSRGHISVESAAVVQPNNDHQLLSHNSHESDSQDQKGVKLSLTSQKEPAPSGEKPFLCKECGKYFQHKKSLFAHVRKVHRMDQPYVCNTCGKRFIHESVFQIHKGVHSDEKPFSCKTCGKNFKFNSGLKVHMLIHTVEKQHSCITCGKTFSYKSLLNEHTRLHTGEKPYSCSTCGKTFRTTSHLRYHIRMHTGERPYSCITCGKTFARPSHFKSHTRTHTGEKPHSCITCGKTFPTKSHLKAHTRVHTGENPYPCKISKVVISKVQGN